MILLNSRSKVFWFLLNATLFSIVFIWILIPKNIANSHESLIHQKQKFIQPQFNLIDKEQNSESIQRGKSYLENTAELLPQNVGAQINCTQCHLNSGTSKNAIHWVGIASQFPQYRDRSGKIDTLEDRLNDCFERSLNGKRLPKESAVMKDILAYMTWLSKGYVPGKPIEGSGVAKIQLQRPPNLENGKEIYTNKCISCHQMQGQGLTVGKKIIFPPLWGQSSFNIGAGMARIQTAAGYVKANMPQGQGGSLTDEEAWDVAGFFISQDRPDYVNKIRDWPKGNKPLDSRY